MTRLLRVEVRRLLSRRAVRGVYAAVAAMLLIFLIRDIVTAGDERYLLGQDGFEAQDGTFAFATVAAFLVGATVTGADWATGVLPHLLVWEPRRLRVLAARLGALLLTIAVATLLALGLALALAYVAAQGGPAPGVPDGFWSEYVAKVGRGLVVVGFAVVAAAGIAGFTRSTGAALGVAFGYTMILENALRVLADGVSGYLVTSNIAAVFSNGSDEEGTYVSAGRGAVTLLVYAVALTAASAVSFTRRDVT